MKIKIKDQLSLAEAEVEAELGNSTMLILIDSMLEEVIASDIIQVVFILRPTIKQVQKVLDSLGNLF